MGWEEYWVLSLSQAGWAVLKESLVYHAKGVVPRSTAEPGGASKRAVIPGVYWFKYPRVLGAVAGLEPDCSVICMCGGGWGQRAGITVPTCAPVSEEIRAPMLAQIVSFCRERLGVASRQPETGRLGVSMQSY